MKIRLNLFVILIACAVASSIYSLFKGSTPFAGYQLIDWLTGKSDPLFQQILFSIRLPRTCSAFVTGGLLALSGALMQILLRNPLADPYVLGVSGGSALLMMLLVLCGASGMMLVGGAWLGSLLAIVLGFVFARSKNFWSSQHLVLTGIALASGFSAVMSFILFISPDRELRGMLFWLIGDLSYAHLPLAEGMILLLGFICSVMFAREFNILLRGEVDAKALGVNTKNLRIFLYLLSSLLTTAAVTLAGCIGFVGLIVPHALRLIGLHDHRLLLPAAILLGGILVTVADTLARTLWSPLQIPVGIMMALIGIPVFLVLLRKSEQE